MPNDACLYFLAAITIKFNETSYSVNECDGQTSIKIEVVTVGSLQRDNISVLLSTSDLTAIGKGHVYPEIHYE